MIKENKEFFLYILGTVALIFLTVVALDVLIPGTFSTSDCGFLGIRCWAAQIAYRNKVYEAPPEMTINPNLDYKATIRTTKGDFKIDLFEKNAPVSVNNFVFLAQDEYFKNVLFHRVIRGTLIQTGDRNTLDGNPENDGLGGPGYTFEDEVNWNSLNFSLAKRQQLKNLGYSTNSGVKSKHLLRKGVAMANDGPNTNGSQFFIVTGDSDDAIVKGLEGRHTVFGTVVEGWDVVLYIESMNVDDETSSSPRPLEDVRVLEVVIEAE